jgi:short subunit dehydrogenase-like uncharacterized protein
MAKVGPKAGDGPRPETLDSWTYQLDVRATTESGRYVDVQVNGDGHPGYKSTATIVGEAALMLADKAAELPQVSGFNTPATAFGIAELKRFERAGLRFTVIEP